MELPVCQNCGAELAEISPRQQFARCEHCGTLHNVSRWFAERLPPVVVELVHPGRSRLTTKDRLRVGKAAAGILFFLGGGTTLLISLSPSVVGNNPDAGIWFLRVVFAGTMLVGVLLGVLAVAGRGRGQRGR